MYRSDEQFQLVLTGFNTFYTYRSDRQESMTLAFPGKTVLSIEDHFRRTPGY
jgi:hypothetical protein